MRCGCDTRPARFAAELEWLHVGGYWTNAANTARYAGHDLANLRLSWQPHPALVVGAAR